MNQSRSAEKRLVRQPSYPESPRNSTHSIKHLTKLVDGFRDAGSREESKQNVTKDLVVTLVPREHPIELSTFQVVK